MNIKEINVGDVLVDKNGSHWKVAEEAKSKAFGFRIELLDKFTQRLDEYNIHDFTLKAPEPKGEYICRFCKENHNGGHEHCPVLDGKPQTEEINGWRVWCKEGGGLILLFNGKVFAAPEDAMSSMVRDTGFYLEPVTLKLERV